MRTLRGWITAGALTSVAAGAAGAGVAAGVQAAKTEPVAVNPAIFKNSRREIWRFFILVINPFKSRGYVAKSISVCCHQQPGEMMVIVKWMVVYISSFLL
jgi:hypothetical protein